MTTDMMAQAQLAIKMKRTVALYDFFAANRRKGRLNHVVLFYCYACHCQLGVFVTVY
jgi:hypothetical protein